MLAEAIEVADAQGARLFGLRTTVDLCRLWLATGRGEEAHERVTTALAAVDAEVDHSDVREANALLASIRPAARKQRK